MQSVTHPAPSLEIGRPDTTGIASDEFAYLAKKILDAPYAEAPFRHILIDEFLSPEHFEMVVSDRQVALEPVASNEALLDALSANEYEAVPFPGCTDDLGYYLECLHADRWPVAKPAKPAYEGFGVAMRLQRYRNPEIGALIAYLNGAEFKAALESRFGLTRPNRIDTAIQKYLSGYEISPHPDVRSKCLTYLVNINPSAEACSMSLHTHLLRFVPDKEFVYEFWEKHETVERCWVPWEWCSSDREIRRNNTIVLFEPHARSLHAVKLRYDHTKLQRTQIYGNLWYTDCDDVRLEDCQHERLWTLRPA